MRRNPAGPVILSNEAGSWEMPDLDTAFREAQRRLRLVSGAGADPGLMPHLYSESPTRKVGIVVAHYPASKLQFMIAAPKELWDAWDRVDGKWKWGVPDAARPAKINPRLTIRPDAVLRVDTWSEPPPRRRGEPAPDVLPVWSVVTLFDPCIESMPIEPEQLMDSELYTRLASLAIGGAWVTWPSEAAWKAGQPGVVEFLASGQGFGPDIIEIVASATGHPLILGNAVSRARRLFDRNGGAIQPSSKANLFRRACGEDARYAPGENLVKRVAAGAYNGNDSAVLPRYRKAMDRFTEDPGKVQQDAVKANPKTRRNPLSMHRKQGPDGVECLEVAIPGSMATLDIEFSVTDWSRPGAPKSVRILPESRGNYGAIVKDLTGRWLTQEDILAAAVEAENDARAMAQAYPRYKYETAARYYRGLSDTFMELAQMMQTGWRASR